MKNRLVQFILAFICIRLAVGCATIIHGSSQSIHVSSVPDSAEVWIDGARVGVTPTKLKLKRKDDYLITVKKAGYKDATTTIESSTSGWLFGNIIFGGLIGCGIDLIDGAAYQLSPDHVDINMTQIAELDGKSIHIDRAQLDKVKQLRFLDEKGSPEVVVDITWTD